MSNVVHHPASSSILGNVMKVPSRAWNCRSEVEGTASFGFAWMKIRFLCPCTCPCDEHASRTSLECKENIWLIGNAARRCVKSTHECSDEQGPLCSHVTSKISVCSHACCDLRSADAAAQIYPNNLGITGSQHIQALHCTSCALTICSCTISVLSNTALAMPSWPITNPP